MAIRKQLARAICWWFGCDGQYQSDSDAMPCRRCGAVETELSDLVGDTRHARFCERVMFWRWIVPTKCKCCGKRWGKHKGCVPF